jgi:hypothetical protein
VVLLLLPAVQLLIFGFGVMFAASFPLAPLIILVNCFVERLLDGSKLFTVFRRAAPEGAEDIGMCIVMSGLRP